MSSKAATTKWNFPTRQTDFTEQQAFSGGHCKQSIESNKPHYLHRKSKLWIKTADSRHGVLWMVSCVHFARKQMFYIQGRTNFSFCLVSPQESLPHDLLGSFGQGWMFPRGFSSTSQQLNKLYGVTLFHITLLTLGYPSTFKCLTSGWAAESFPKHWS